MHVTTNYKMSALIGSLILGVLLNYLLARLFEASFGPNNARQLYDLPLNTTDHPYFVQLHHCRGAILSEQWVITAAHCVDKIRSVQRHPQPIWVRGETEESKNYTYNRIIIHPNYKKNRSFDIALLRMTQKIEFSSNVKAIELPKHNIKDRIMLMMSKGKVEGVTGNPLVSNSTLIGISIDCDDGQPTSYINIAYLAPWIKGITGL